MTHFHTFVALCQDHHQINRFLQTQNFKLYHDLTYLIHLCINNCFVVNSNILGNTEQLTFFKNSYF